MKIRVVSLKNTSSYFIKIISLVIITVLFGQFFYSTKNVKASIKIDSSKISSTINKIMNTEIVLFKNIENNKNLNKQIQKNNFDFSFFQKEAINQELELARLTNARSESNSKNLIQEQGNILNENQNENYNNENINNNENNQEYDVNSQNNIIEEPAVR